jgi:hypothetical protein
LGHIVCGQIQIVILPAHLNIFSKQAEDCEETGQSSTAANLVEKLVSVKVLIIPYTLLDFRGMVSLSKDLNSPFHNTVETFVLVQ